MAVWTVGELLAGLAAGTALVGTFRQSFVAGLVAGGLSVIYVGVRFMPPRLQWGLVALTSFAALLQGLGPATWYGPPEMHEITAVSLLVGLREVVRILLLFPLLWIYALVARHPDPWQVVEVVRGDLLLSGIPLWFGCGVISAATWISRQNPQIISWDASAVAAAPADPLADETA